MISLYTKVEILYNSVEERNINKLQKLYNDEILASKVKKLFSDTFNDIEGKRILIKPNWVKHATAKSDKWCLCTHENLIYITVKFLLSKNPSKIIIGDAPIQGCDWNLLLSEDFVKRINQLSKDFGVEIVIKDFRRVIFNPKTNEKLNKNISLSEYIIFDMKEKSYLEPISDNKNKFRVTCYNPDRLAQSHSKGVHKYCIAKDVFDSDIIITMPKMKTHQKAGITNAMKILVGINGDKDFLPHHRIGAKGYGGDCYPGKNAFRTISEWVLDNANRNIGNFLYKPLLYVSSAFWKISRPTKEQNLAAGWYGNDTVWRMVMDLNHIAQYGNSDGSLSDKPQRLIYSLSDGIIGGQGNGPLSPEPLPLGVLAFSNNSYWMDLVMGYLFSLNIDKIPNLKAAKDLLNLEECELYINGKTSCIEDLKQYSVKVKMSPGWENYDKI